MEFHCIYSSTTSLCPFYSYLLPLVLCLLKRCKARIWVTFPGSHRLLPHFLILNTELQAAGSQSVPPELFMAAEAVSAGCPLHLAVYRHVFSAPGAQAQMCIPADKASIFRVLSLMCSAQEHQLISSSPDLCHIFTVTVGALEDGAFSSATQSHKLHDTEIGDSNSLRFWNGDDHRGPFYYDWWDLGEGLKTCMWCYTSNIHMEGYSKGS